MKLLKDEEYRQKMGKEARSSMIKFSNDLLLKRWIKLILSIYSSNSFNDNNYNYKDLYKKISEKEALYILQKQIKLYNIRKKLSKAIMINDLKNINFINN